MLNRKTFKALFGFFIILSFIFITGCKCKKDDGKKDDGKDKVYYYVTFDAENGSQNNMIQVEENTSVSKPVNPVLDGYTFLYWTKDNVEFDFNSKINEHITLVAKYEKNIVKTSRVIWNEDEAISYLYDGDVPRTVEVGSTVKFKINVSPFYEGTLKVVANGKEIKVDDNGYYSFVVEDVTTTTITTSGLEKLNDKISGSGTNLDPYIIENAAQFNTFIDGVNSTDSTRYNGAYFELINDIDFKGYTLDTIGNTLNVNEFSGVFNGNNHTLSNFQLKDDYGLFGLFGYLVTAELKNLNLKTDLVSIPNNNNFNLVGSLVAYNIGSDIYNCSFNGSIMIKNDLAKSVLVHAGGLVGYMQSYSTTYSASLTHCYVDCDMISNGETELTSVGGIVGLLFGSSVEVPAFVYSTKFNGNISGLSVVSGGIVGTLRQNTSVVECYTRGNIEAISNSRNTAAGGIVGLAETETSVAYCFSISKIVSSSNSAEYIVGDIVGSAWTDGTNQIDNKKVLEVQNYYSENNKITVNNNTYDFTNIDDVVKLLAWNKNNWNSEMIPNYNEDLETKIEIKFDFGRDLTNEGIDGTLLTQKVDTVTTNGFIPLQWVYNSNGMNSFTADDGTISYGYFLDEERTIRVPASYILTKNTTIYVGFADYKEVEGEYYISINNIDIKLYFDDNGKMTLYYDGIIDNCMYVYNGKTILIKDAYFAYLVYPDVSEQTTDFYYDFYAYKHNKDLIIYNNDLFSLEDDLAMTATKRNNAMGSWYSADDLVYTFLSDGTGSISSGETFIYECNENNLTITIGKNVINATISDDGNSIKSINNEAFSISKFDIFKGVWETEFDNQKHITFDGKGNVIYNEQTYSYIINENNEVIFGENVAKFNEDGLLELNDEIIFGREGSFIGTWIDTSLDYWISFNGITKDGYGTGYDSNGFSFVYVLDSLETGLKGFITMYYGTSMYGYAELAVGKDGSEMLYLAVYTPESGIIVDDYNACYLDSFYGIWNAKNGLTLEFNGLGAYDIYEWIYSLDSYWDARGFVSITENGNTTNVRYTFDRKTRTGTFEYNGVTYNIDVVNGELLINEVNYKMPDGLEIYAYQTQDLVLVFNGKSNVELGIVDITKNNLTMSYQYIINDSNIEIYENDILIYTLDLTNEIKLIDHKTSTSQEVGLYHDLIGKTYTISANTELVLDNIFDINGISVAKFISDGEIINIDLKYIDKNYIAMYLDNEFFYYLYFLDENCAALCDYSFSPIGVIAIADELKGIWIADNGEKIAFDGLSKAVEYVDANCEITETDETGTYIEVYTYEKQDNYYVVITTINGIETEKYLVYMTYQENSVAYKQGDRTIYLVSIN